MDVDKIQNIIASEHIPVFGIGPASDMEDEPPGHRPEDYMPGVQSLICFGIPVPRSVYASERFSAEAAWRSQNLLYRRLDTLALRLSAVIEESGARALPIYGCMPLGVNRKGVVVGLINQMRMAEVIGIGVIGKNGLLIHRHYGSRLMLGGLLTTAILPVMRSPVGDEPGCPPGCNICIDACPVNAIIPDRNKVEIMRCLSHTAHTPAMSRLKFLYLRMRNKMAAARYMSITSFDEHTFHICSKCVTDCPYGNL